MVDPVTTNMQFAVPTRGSDVGTWDTPINGDWNIADSAFGGVTSVSLTNVNVSLSISQAQKSVLRFSGTLTGNVQITLPAIVKFWTVQNITTGAFVITLTTGAGKVLGLPPTEPVDVFSDGTDLYFKNFGRIGTYEDYAGSSVPTWVAACTVPPYLICDGTTFSSGTYPSLNTILGTTTLPDLRGRARYYLNGGTGRITTAGSNIDGDTRFSAGGAQTITLDTTMIPPHTHSASVTDPGHVHDIDFDPFSQQNFGSAPANVVNTSRTTSGHVLTAVTGISVTNTNTGGGLAHNNMTPALIGGITMIRAA